MFIKLLIPLLTNSNKFIINIDKNIDIEKWSIENHLDSETLSSFDINGEMKGLILDTDKDQNILEHLPNVENIEEDKIFTIDSFGDVHIENNPGIKHSFIIWGLDRIDQESLPLDNNYSHIPDAGENIDVYILDTGIETSHPQFEGRAQWGNNFVDNQNEDCNGHGTHVAGTVMSKDYGVAIKANSIAVKVLDCEGSGSFSGIISGIQWSINRIKSTGRKGVINMSLGGGFSSLVNSAVNAARNSGVVVVVSAGNENQDACNQSPASASKAFTVASSRSDDIRSGFSNWGSCVDIFAPGSSITSTYINGQIATISGTSMSSPHVAGAVAWRLSEQPDHSPKEIEDYLLNLASSNKIIDTKGSPNKLLRVNSGDRETEKEFYEKWWVIAATVGFIIIVIIIIIQCINSLC